MPKRKENWYLVCNNAKLRVEIEDIYSPIPTSYISISFCKV